MINPLTLSHFPQLLNFLGFSFLPPAFRFLSLALGGCGKHIPLNVSDKAGQEVAPALRKFQEELNSAPPELIHRVIARQI